MFKLSFYVPQAALDSVKQAVFDAGAGKMGHYDQCCWQVLGQGQFRPLQGSDPDIGVADQITCISEWKVELICEEALIETAVAALKSAHPYEEVAYEVVRLVSI